MLVVTLRVGHFVIVEYARAIIHPFVFLIIFKAAVVSVIVKLRVSTSSKMCNSMYNIFVWMPQ